MSHWWLNASSSENLNVVMMAPMTNWRIIGIVKRNILGFLLYSAYAVVGTLIKILKITIEWAQDAPRKNNIESKTSTWIAQLARNTMNHVRQVFSGTGAWTSSLWMRT